MKGHAPKKHKWWHCFVMVNFSLWVVSILFITLLYSSIPLESHRQTRHRLITLKNEPKTYVKYDIIGLKKNEVLSFNLCCNTNNYLVCNSGQGHSSNLEVECFLGDDHILIYSASVNINCIFSWDLREHGHKK